MFDWVLNTSLIFNTFVGDAPFLYPPPDDAPFLYPPPPPLHPLTKKKLNSFLMFSRGKERVHWEQMG